MSNAEQNLEILRQFFTHGLWVALAIGGGIGLILAIVRIIVQHPQRRREAEAHRRRYQRAVEEAKAQEWQPPEAWDEPRT